MAEPPAYFKKNSMAHKIKYIKCTENEWLQNWDITLLTPGEYLIGKCNEDGRGKDDPMIIPIDEVYEIGQDDEGLFIGCKDDPKKRFSKANSIRYHFENYVRVSVK